MFIVDLIIFIFVLYNLKKSNNILSYVRYLYYIYIKKNEKLSYKSKRKNRFYTFISLLQLQ